MKKITLYFLLLGMLSVIYGQENTQEVKEISRSWTAFTQKIEVSVKKKTHFKFKAAVKIETNDEMAWSGIWARVDNNNGETGFFDNMNDRPIKSDIWAYYEIQGTIDEHSEFLNFGGLCLKNGAFYFDDFQLSFQDESGAFVPYTILNADFEGSTTKVPLEGWGQGVNKAKITKVKEYEMFIVSDAQQGEKVLKVIGKGIDSSPETIGVSGNKGEQVHIEAMISMLEDLKKRVHRKVKGMSQYQIDHLHDEKANRIGALIMHLAAAEAYYQVFTFENRGFNEEEEEKWGAALNLDQAGRDAFKGKDIQHYLDIYDKVREKTLVELRKRDDQWFQEIQMRYGWSNQYCWFHVMEHQSSHLGQILFLAKRIPPEPIKEGLKEDKIKG